MQLATIIAGITCCLAAAKEPYRFAKGYVRPAHRNVLEVEEITSELKDNAPDSVDWSTKGAITPVKNQGQCGDCWAFATTEGIESAVFMKTKSLIALSEQQITSCDTDVNGCSGGDPQPALDYVKKAGGIDLQSDYPDTSPKNGATGNCSWNGKKAAVVHSWRYAVPNCDSGSCSNQDENAVAAAIAKYGPLTICLNAGPWNNSQG